MIGNVGQIDQLVTSGLGPVKKLAYIRIIMSDPRTGIYNMVYRNLASDIFTKIARYVLNDQVLYNRLKSLLLAEPKPKLEDVLLDDADDRLVGTDRFLKFAQDNVPGQCTIRNKTKRTLDTIKKASKKK